MLVSNLSILTDALAIILHREPGLPVVGVAATYAAVREGLSHTCPDVLLLDVWSPDSDGLSLVPEVNRLCPGLYILGLASLSDRETLAQALEIGVKGFVLLDRPLSEAVTAIRGAAAQVRSQGKA
jgi:DNA-binding NarL/FixJ family response regulator